MKEEDNSENPEGDNEDDKQTSNTNHLGSKTMHEGSPHCDKLNVMEGILLRLVRCQVGWPERRDRARLRKTACKGRSCSDRSTYRIQHPKLYGTHARSYESRRSVKREELPKVVNSDLIDDDKVTYIETKGCKFIPPKKRIENRTPFKG